MSKKKEVKNLGGRPTLLDEEMMKKARGYVMFFVEANNEQMENHKEAVPTIAGMSIFLGVSRSTIYEWESVNKEFSDITSDLLAVQEALLVNGSLKGKLNHNISKLILSKHGYSEKQEIKMDINPVSQLMDEIIGDDAD